MNKPSPTPEPLPRARVPRAPRRPRLPMLALLSLSGFGARAHPGHGISGVDPSHWVTSPDHALPGLAVGLLLWFIGSRAHRQGSRALLRALAVAAFGAGLLP